MTGAMIHVDYAVGVLILSLSKAAFLTMLALTVVSLAVKPARSLMPTIGIVVTITGICSVYVIKSLEAGDMFTDYIMMNSCTAGIGLVTALVFQAIVEERRK